MATTEDLDRPEREFEQGIQQITAALVDVAKKTTIAASAENVALEPAWRRGRPIPDKLRFKLTPPGAPLMAIVLSRDQIEDCWNGIDRPEVRQIMREITRRYRLMQGGNTDVSATEVTVHSFHLYSAEQDNFVLARGKAPLEKIVELGGRVVPNTEEVVDRSLLTETGRYHPPEERK